MIRVMLVDDQARELEGMRSIIRWEEMDMQVVQAAADARDALAYARQNGVDLVITDVMMPDMDGLALMEELRALSPWTKVICVSCFDDYKFVSGAVNRGACGYLLKPILSGELKTLLRRVQGDIAREQAALCARDGHAPVQKNESAQSAREAVGKILENIESHYCEDISLDAVLEGVYLSRGYAGTLFKNETGMTIHQYIINRRLERATALLLESPPAKIYDIAWQCGFVDASHFINAFRQKYHCTPMQYRRRGRA